MFRLDFLYVCLFASNQTSGGKLFSLLKDSRVFLASPASKPRQRKKHYSYLADQEIGEWKDLVCNSLPSETGGNPWFPWMTEVTGQQHRGRRKKSQTWSVVSPFVSAAIKSIAFSPFCFCSFKRYITEVSFVFSLCVLSPPHLFFFNAWSLTIRSFCPLGPVLYHWIWWLFCH